MKPAAFEYVAARSLAEAVAALADGEAKVLAGGQSLIPALNMRLASPTRLVDLNRVAELAYVRERDGGVAIGAMTRDSLVERDGTLARQVPLLVEAIRYVGHPQIRNRGTVGGSLAHADPAAELPAVAACLDARVTLLGPGGERTLPVAELYLGYLTTAIGPDELLVEVWFPAAPPSTGHAWIEFAQRHGDYALAGVGVAITVDEQGERVRQARIALTGVGAMPVRAREAERLVVGSTLEDDRVRAAVEAVRGAIEPEADVHASAAYRRHLAGVLAERALRLAYSRAHSASAASRSHEPPDHAAHGGSALDVRRALEELGRYA